MTETPVTFTPTSPSNTASFVEHLRADYLAAGRGDEFETLLARHTAAVSSPGATDDPPAAPAAAPATAPADELGAAKQPQLSPSEVASARADWIKYGLDPAKFEAAMHADGVAALDPADVPSPEQAAVDAEYDIRNPSPSSYRINYADAISNAPSGATLTGDALADFNSEAQSFLSATGIPPEIGVGMIERSLRVGQTFQAMTPAEQAGYKASERYDLERHAGGKEQADNLVVDAAVALRRAPGAFRDILFSSGALNDAYAIRSLAAWGRNLANHAAARPAK